MTAIRKLPAALLLALAASLPLSGATTAGAPVAAPEFRLANRAGGQVTLSSLRGQVVMINFWASWCGPCRQEFPALDQIYRKYKPMGFTLVGINVESEKSDAERFLGQRPVSFPILFDPKNEVSGDYGVRAMPTTVLVDRRGRLRWTHMAYKPGDEAKYIEQVRAALREKP
ncbi:MAG: TlpA disulfide reductase family protein [Gammaproteobacteria bacterium]